MAEDDELEDDLEDIEDLEGTDSADDGELDDFPEDGELGNGDPDADDLDDLDLDDLDFDDDDFDDDDDEGGGGDKKKWIAIGGGASILVAGFVGAAMIIFGSEDDHQEAEPSKSLIPVVSMAIAPKKSKMRTGRELLKPPSSSSKGATHAVERKVMGRPADASQPASPAPRAAPQADRRETSSAGASATAGGPRQAAVTPQQSRGQTAPGAGIIIPATTAVSFRGIPVLKGGKPLAAPETQLSEAGASGAIPRIADDGRQAWRVYASPFTGDNSQPRISIIFTGLGLSRASTMAAIKQLPPEISLSFNPYAKNVADWVGLARSSGHETLMSLPMESADFPVSDPGPYALQTDVDAAENINRLKFIMGLAPGNVGMLQMMGSRFATSELAVRPILEEIRNRGLLFVGNGVTENDRAIKIASAIALPRAGAVMKIDSEASRATINRNLAKLEVLAQKNKFVVALAEPYPVTISYISRWLQTLPGKKIILAPVSAVTLISGVATQEPAPGTAEGEPATAKKKPEAPRK